MRICLISREFPPDTGWGGVGAYNFHTAKGLLKAGHDVEVISLAAREISASESFEQNIDGIKVHRVVWQNNLEELNLFLISAPNSHFVLKSGTALWKKFIEIHNENPFDVVETPEHLATAIFNSNSSVVPLLITLHTPHFKFVDQHMHEATESFDNLLISMFEKMSILQADVVASPSHDLAHYVSEHTGLSEQKIEIVRNPVDTDIFKPEGDQALTTESTMALFVGRLETRKGVHTLVEAIPLVLKAVPKLKFVLVGSDTNYGVNGGSVRTELERTLKANSCLQSVSFISHVDLTDMPKIYRSADFCIIPSIYDNAPYTCIEALASGKPVIVSNAGGTKEYVEPGITGFVTEANNAQTLANAIIDLSLDETKRIQFGSAARIYAENYLNLDKFVKKKVDLYDRAIESHKTNREFRMYRLSANKILGDTLNVMCSFDQMIFDVLSKQSTEFRLKHWARLVLKRPKLALAVTILNLLNFGKLLGIKMENTNLYKKLRQSVLNKMPPPFENTRRYGQIEPVGRIIAKNIPEVQFTGNVK